MLPTRWWVNEALIESMRHYLEHLEALQELYPEDISEGDQKKLEAAQKILAECVSWKANLLGVSLN